MEAGEKMLQLKRQIQEVKGFIFTLGESSLDDVDL